MINASGLTAWGSPPEPAKACVTQRTKPLDCERVQDMPRDRPQARWCEDRHPETPPRQTTGDSVKGGLATTPPTPALMESEPCWCRSSPGTRTRGHRPQPRPQSEKRRPSCSQVSDVRSAGQRDQVPAAALQKLSSWKCRLNASSGEGRGGGPALLRAASLLAW